MLNSDLHQQNKLLVLFFDLLATNYPTCLVSVGRKVARTGKFRDILQQRVIRGITEFSRSYRYMSLRVSLKYALTLH